MRVFLIIIIFFNLILTGKSFAKTGTPVSLLALNKKMVVGETIKWEAPDYSRQENRLGYQEEDFSPSPDFERQFGFWKDIYSKYDSNIGVIHDSEHIDLIYEVLKFPSLTKDAELNRKIRKERSSMVKEAKKRARSLLDQLQKHQDQKRSAAMLDGELLRVWNFFAKEKGRHKFRQAKSRNRLRMQLGQKDQFLLSIYYSGRYLKRIEKIFEEFNLPKELTRLPIVESSFNILARSKVGASGIWQFMRSAAKPYLEINQVVDERNAPLKASRAAAKVLRNNYRMLQNWPMAITAYNYGPSGLRRLARRYKTNNLAEIIEKEEKSRFGFASRNFYTSFLAAVHVEKNADRYFDQPLRAKKLEFDAFQLDRPIKWSSLVQWFGDQMLAQIYNPSFSYRVRRGWVAIPEGLEVNIMSEKLESFRSFVARLPKPKEMRKYKIRRGDTLSVIARKFGVSMRRLKKINGLVSAHRIKHGQTLYIPNSL